MRRFAGWVAGVTLLVGGVASAGETAYVRLSDPARMMCTSAPADWTRPELDDGGWSPKEQPPPQPLPGADGSIPDGGTVTTGCAGTAFLRWHFDAGPELAKLASVTLRIRYTHGFAAYLNGVEVARRRLDARAPASAVALDYHGPEFERVFVPLKPGLLRPHGNVLAVEVHPRTAGREPVAAVELSGADGVRIVRGPYLSRLSETSVSVVFDTDLPSLGELRWGESEPYAELVTDAPPQRHHVLRMTGLKPGAQAHYRVVARAPLQVVAQVGSSLPVADPQPGDIPADAFDGGDVQFHTPPEAGRPLRFVVYGDVRSGHDVHALLDRQVLAEDPDLALVTGDLVDRGSDEGDWERFFEISGPLLKQIAIFPAPGNHEYARLGRGAQSFMQLFRWPLKPGEDDAGYYSFDLAGVHFAALDSNQYRSPGQLAWLERDLTGAEANGARALFVFAHEPPYSTGLHGDNQTMIHDYVPLLERHHVAMFFGGHDHHYERGKVGTLDYVITGGGGAELRTLRCGVAGKRPCPPSVRAIANEHHYVLVEVLPAFFRVCAKRPDGSPLEACVELPLPAQHQARNP